MGKVKMPSDVEIARIRRESEEAAKHEIRAVSVSYEPAGRVITLRVEPAGAPGATVVRFLATLLPELAQATDEQLAELEVFPGGTTLALESLDLHLSVEGVIFRALLGADWLESLKHQAGKRLGASKSAAKAAASRSNGAKGGRPRKTAAIAEGALGAEHRAEAPKG